MSATTPTSYTAASYSEMVSGETIDAADWLAESQNLHHLYSRAGARCPLYLAEGDPFETDSTTYTQTNSGSGADLDRYTGIVRVTRPLRVGGAEGYALRVKAYGQDITVKATFFAPDGNTTLGTVEIALGSTWEWGGGNLTLTAAQAGEGGVAGAAARAIGVTLEAKATSAEDTGHLFQAFAFEFIATATNLPDGT